MQPLGLSSLIPTHPNDTQLHFASDAKSAHRYVRRNSAVASREDGGLLQEHATVCWKCGGRGRTVKKNKKRRDKGGAVETGVDTGPPSGDDGLHPPNPKNVVYSPCQPCKGLGHSYPTKVGGAPTKPTIRPFKPPACWVARGPEPKGSAENAEWAPGEGEMLTALSGKWMIYQLTNGHRSTTDDVLTAAIALDLVQSNGIHVERYMDIGCGLGSVLGMVGWGLLQWEHTLKQATGVEAQTVHVHLARRTLAFNAFTLATIHHFDLRDLVSGSSTLPSNGRFTLITGTPPYFPSTAGSLPTHPNRGMCSFELRGGIETYCQAAAKYLAPGPKSRFVVCQTGLEILRTETAAKSVGMCVVERWDCWGREERGGTKPLISVFVMAWGEWRGDYNVRVLCVRDREGEFSGEMVRLMEIVGKPPPRSTSAHKRSDK